MTLPLAVALPFLGELAALFAVGAVVAYLAYRLGLVPIAGFLLTGAVIGPNALGLVQDEQLVTQVAEVGVILLLFSIGAEFSLAELRRVRRVILIGGGLQVTATAALVAGALLAFGVDAGPAVFTGFLVALSSTAIVIGLLTDRRETDTPVGRMALAILIFQDLALIPIVLLLPILGGAQTSPAEIGWALGKALLMIVGVLVLARRAVPWLLDRVARTRRQELFALAVAALVAGTAFLAGLAGVSLALGAFLAGLVMSESPYRDHALSEVLPLRTLFSAVFFVSVGMLLNPAFIAENLLLVLGATLVVLMLKAALVTGSVLILKMPVRIAAAVGLTLAQIGEFSFVLAVEGARYGLAPLGNAEAGLPVLVAATVVLMGVTPFLMGSARRAGEWVEGRLPSGRSEPPHAPPEDGHAALEDHVLILGYGTAGRHLARVLLDVGIPAVVVDLNPQNIADAAEAGVQAVHGDAARPMLLHHAGVERAKLCVVAINDRAITERAVRIARDLNPTLQIVARARYLTDVEPLARAGADVVIPEELETSVRIFTQVLSAYMVPRDEIDRQAAAVRSGNYAVFRSALHEAHLMVLQGLDEEGLHTRAVAVRPGAAVAGRTLGELALRQAHGLTVLAVRRDGRTVGSPAGDYRLEPGDRLVLVGTAEQFVQSADLFRPHTDGEAGGDGIGHRRSGDAAADA